MLIHTANSLGTTVGPLVGAALILGVVAADASAVKDYGERNQFHIAWIFVSCGQSRLCLDL